MRAVEAREKEGRYLYCPPLERLNMRYIIINKITNSPIVDNNQKVIVFKSQTTAQKYICFTLKDDSSHYHLKKYYDDIIKKELEQIELQIKDLYHAIEYASDNDALLSTAQVLQIVLQRRRKLRDKLKGEKL